MVIKSYTGNFALISARHYKFYIAFENGDCDDYITEKFFRTLKDVSPDQSFQRATQCVCSLLIVDM